MGLVSAGRASHQSFLTRLPSLQAPMGPIKATSFKSAKEMAKKFRAAYSVSHYSALEMCGLIWVSVPQTALEGTVQDLAAQMPVHRTMIVLCDCLQDSSWPKDLSKAGARIASLNLVEGAREKVFVAEGDAEVLSLLKRLLWADRRQLIQMAQGAKPLYFAGISAATEVVLPWVDSSVRWLRSAGFTRADAMRIADALVTGKLKDYTNTGAKCWRESHAAELEQLLAKNLEVLKARDLKLAQAFDQGVRLAIEHFSPKRSSVAGA